MFNKGFVKMSKGDKNASKKIESFIFQYKFDFK